MHVGCIFRLEIHCGFCFFMAIRHFKNIKLTLHWQSSTNKHGLEQSCICVVRAVPTTQESPKRLEPRRELVSATLFLHVVLFTYFSTYIILPNIKYNNRQGRCLLPQTSQPQGIPIPTGQMWVEVLISVALFLFLLLILFLISSFKSINRVIYLGKIIFYSQTIH